MLRNLSARHTIGVVNTPKRTPGRGPQRRTRRTSSWAVLTAVLGVLAGFGLMYFIAGLAGRGDIDLKLGDEVFEVGQVERLSKAIAKDGPLLIPDASPNKTRDIYVQHLSDDPQNDWLAFAARPSGSPRECNLVWDAGAKNFLDPCGTNRFPGDGKGLTGYIVRVRDNKLYVEIRIRETDTTAVRPNSP